MPATDSARRPSRLVRCQQLVLILALVVAVGGRALLQREVQEPEVRLSKVELTRLGLTEQDFRLTLAVDNPNSFSLPVRRLRYDVELAGIPFASGVTDDGLEIAADGTSEIQLGINTNLLTSVPELFNLIRDGRRSFDYNLSGEVEYGRILRGSRPFEQSGRVELSLP